MTLPSMNYWIMVQITLKAFADASTKYVYFTNREITGNTLGTYLPLLIDVGDVGQVMDRFAPSSFNGSITIIDALESFGAERKFSDLLQRYTIIDQDLEVFTAETTLADNNPSFTSRWKGKILNSTRRGDSESPTLQINAEARVYPRRAINRVLDSTAPQQSINKPIPFVLGAARDVKPLIVSSGTTAAWAYGTTLATQYVNGGVQGYYLPAAAGGYAQVDSAASTSTKVYERDLSAYTIRAAPISDELNTDWTRAIDIGWASNKRHVLTQGYFYFGKAASTTMYGSITFEIWEKDPITGGPGIRRGSGKFDKELITWSTTAHNKVEFVFDAPIALNSSNGYYLVVRQTTTNGSAYIRTAAYISSPTSDYWIESNGSWYLYYNNIEGDAPASYWALFACVFTDTTSPGGPLIDVNGLGYSYFTVTQKAVLSYYSIPDISKLDWIVNVNGLLDSSTGTISGTNNKQLDTFNHQAQLICLTWNGANWSTPSWYDASYTTGHTKVFVNDARKTQGVFSDLTYVEEALRELAENAASRIFLRNSGKLAVAPWGAAVASSFTFSQDDCEVLNHETYDPANVINRIRFGYNRNFINFNAFFSINLGIDGDYQAILDWYTGASSPITSRIGNSPTLFGDRWNERESYDFIADSATAEQQALYLLATFSRPAEYVFVSAPWAKYKDLEPMQVGNIVDPALPAFYGSSAAAKLPDHSGLELDPLGHPLTRAQMYRIQIESRIIKFQTGKAPSLIFGCRLLLNGTDQA